jgi:hypothetical protein
LLAIVLVLLACLLIFKGGYIYEIQKGSFRQKKFRAKEKKKSLMFHSTLKIIKKGNFKGLNSI